MFGNIKDNNLLLPIKKMGDVVEIRNGRDYKAIQNDNGKYPVYGTGGIMTYADDFLCPENTVILGRKGTIDNPLLVKEKFWNVDTAFGMICDQIVLNPVYYFWFCKQYDFKKHNKATTIPSLVKADLQKINIIVPEKGKQDEFATFVEQVDKSKVIKESIKSRFNELFGTYCPTHKLKEACTLISRGKSASYVEKSDYYIIGQACIRLDRIEFDRVRCMNPSKYDEGYVLKNGDILVNSTGVGSLGRCNTFYNPDNRVYFTDSHVTILRLNLEIIDPTFLKYYLNQNNIQSELYSKCVTGSTNQIELNKAAFTVFPIPIPPIDVQKKFSNYVKQVDKSKVGILSTILLINNYTITGLWYDG